ncbi:MAG: hypothetical protein WCW53_14230 [Syntrophales bacterium]
MDLPRRIVISRKGFDGGTGCIPSPILSDGTMISIPIPKAADTVSYADLRLNGHSYGKLVTDLRAQRMTRNKEKKLISATDMAHMDPDLIRDMLPRKPDWRPAFGPSAKAATILRKHCVGRGDLFLFFGWFRRCELAGGTYRFISDEPKLHVVYGYLRISDVYPLPDDRVPDWLKDHPHFHVRARKADTVFVAADHLGLPGADELPGAAAFPTFSDALRLTAPGMTRSWWQLPKWFYPAPGVPPLSSHEKPDRWRLQSDSCLLQSVSRGQEFVLDTEHYPEALEWAVSIIRNGIGVN